MRKTITAALLALTLASPAWAGQKIKVPSLHFAMELPGGWVEQEGKRQRESLAKRAAKGDPSFVNNKKMSLVLATLTKKAGDLRNPRLDVIVHLYGDIGKRDLLRVAKDSTEKGLKADGDRVRNLEIADPVEVSLGGRAVAMTAVTATARRSKSDEWVDVEVQSYIAVFDEYFIEVLAIRPAEESEVVIADMKRAIESIRFD